MTGDDALAERALRLASDYQDVAERLLILSNEVRDRLEAGDPLGALGMLCEVLHGQPGANAIRVKRAQRELEECAATRH